MLADVHCAPTATVEAGFAHLLRPGPQIGEAGRRLIGDPSLATRLAAPPCPYGHGRASERIAECARQFLAAAR